MVELAPVGDSRLVDATVAATVGAVERPQEALRDAVVERLQTSAALLVLDNCEHLLDAVAVLTRHLLLRCPQLRILCTSRERLGVTGEVVVPVPGLPVPTSDTHLAASIGRSGAVRLFVDRACAAQPRFRLTDDNARAVAEITSRLDGLPLSIELAAARAGSFAAGQIAAGLTDRFRLLSRGSREALPRHQTLRAVVDWSFGLLTDAERSLFARLAVFCGGFTYAAAAAVCGDDDADLLARLVDKSLIVADAVEAPEYRYRMLETLRDYALEELERSEVSTSTRKAHALYFRDLTATAAAALRSADLAEWLDRLRAEHANLRAALDWCLATGEHETAAEIAAATYPFWDLRGYYAEGRGWLARALENEQSVSTAVRARVLMGEATLGVIQGDIEAAAAAADAAAELSRSIHDGAGLAHALQYSGFVCILVGDLAKAHALLSESEQTATAAQAAWEQAWAHVFLATLALAEHRFAEAASAAERGVQLVGTAGDREALAWFDVILGISDWGLRRRGEAAARFTRGAVGFHGLGGLWGVSFALLGAGLVLADLGNARTAIRLFGASEAIRRSAGVSTIPFAAQWMDNAVATIRDHMPGPDIDTEWAAGEGTSVDEAIRTMQSELRSKP